MIYNSRGATEASTVALKEDVDVDWSLKPFRDLFEARELSEDDVEDVEVVVKTGAGKLLCFKWSQHIYQRPWKESPRSRKGAS